MDGRKIKILQAIINDYINYGEPVGSRTIAKKYDLGISSATIRNEMADLEEMGFLEQLHTSSGRKPSDKGYRLYVDKLMGTSILLPEEQEAIKNYLIDIAFYEVDKIIRAATNILSDLTKLTSIVKAPSVKKSSIKIIQLISLDRGSILSTIITDSGIIKHNLIKISNPIDLNKILKVNNILNKALSGITIQHISLDFLLNLKQELMGFEEIFDAMIPVLYESLVDNEYGEVYTQGTTNIFNYAEYNNIDKAKEFLGLVNNEESLKNILEQSNVHGSLSVKIGQENFVECAKECSIITATYSYNGNTLGTIGVIGPTRIPYAKVISVLDSIVTEINNNISKIYDNSK
ncbi:heat-inducible transcriptional repressor HrcA [Clostridium sp.]|uniref:heat-inducible transcriptional repressor HrcA n=1 Tax=Clostridium sp. TaxID=1506 RepID=UPI002FC8904C